MRKRHLSSALVGLMAAPLLAVAPVSIPRATAEPHPVPTSQRQVDLTSPGSPEVGDGDVATSGDLGLAKRQAVTAGAPAATIATPRVLEVSEPQSVPRGIAVLGVTYDRAPSKATVVQYRTNAGGTAWGAWQAIDSDTAQGEGEGGRAGSDPIVVSDSAWAQVRVLGPAAEKAPGARLSVIDPGTSDADAGVGARQPGTAQAAAAAPTIHSRREWGANESWRKSGPSYTHYKGVIVHHTAGTNNYTPSQVPAVLRGIYAFHTKDRGWNDIAYNFLVDRWGRVWEGRYGGTTSSVMGAHALNWNTETLGVSIMGDFQNAPVPADAVTAVERVIAWKAGLAGFNPTGTARFYPSGGPSGGVVRPVVQGHRDVGSTTCPGNFLYAKMSQIRSTSAAMMRAGGSSAPAPAPAPAPTPVPAPKPAPTTPSPTGAPAASDVLMRGSSNALYRSKAVGTADMGYASKVSTLDWSAFDKVFSTADMTGDRVADVVGRTKAGGLYLYPGTASGALGAGRRIGTAWQVMSMMSTGDVDGDGKVDIVAVKRATGQLFLYPGQGNGMFGRSRVIGSAWGGFAHLAVVGDWDGDRRNDLVGVTTAGVAYLYRGLPGARFAAKTKLSGAFAAYRSLVALPGMRTLFGVDAQGTGWMIRRTGATTTSATKASPNFKGLTVFSG